MTVRSTWGSEVPVPRVVGAGEWTPADAAGGEVWLSSEAVAAAGLPAGEPRVKDAASHPWLRMLPEGWRWVTSGLTNRMRAQGPGRAELVVVVPQWGRLDPFGAVAGDLAGLRAAVRCWTEVTGGEIRWMGSGGVTSQWMLRGIVHGRRVTPAVEPVPGWTPPGLRFRKVRQAPRRFVHLFDVNACYLAAARDLPLPDGERSRWVETFGKRLPGWWTIDRVSDRVSGMVPTPLVVSPEAVLGGWVWRQHHPWLQPWHLALRDARTACLERNTEASRVALAALKTVWAQGPSMLSRQIAKPDDPLNQPVWTQLILANAAGRLRGAISRMAYRPFAAGAVDMVALWSDQPMPADAAADHRLPLGTRAGEWKPAGSLGGELAAKIGPNVVRLAEVVHEQADGDREPVDA